MEDGGGGGGGGFERVCQVTVNTTIFLSFFHLVDFIFYLFKPCFLKLNPSLKHGTYRLSGYS